MAFTVTCAVFLACVTGSLQEAKPFPDTKQNHWAYEAVVRCKANGLLTSDSPRMGNWPLARSSFAWCVKAVFKRLTRVSEQLSIDVADVNAKIAYFNRPWEAEWSALDKPNDAEVKRLKEAIADLLDWTEEGQSCRRSIKDLLKLTKEFGPDLVTQGVDPKGLTRGLLDLDKRFGRITVSKRD